MGRFVRLPASIPTAKALGLARFTPNAWCMLAVCDISINANELIPLCSTCDNFPLIFQFDVTAWLLATEQHYLRSVFWHITNAMEMKIDFIFCLRPKVSLCRHRFCIAWFYSGLLHNFAVFAFLWISFCRYFAFAYFIMEILVECAAIVGRNPARTELSLRISNNKNNNNDNIQRSTFLQFEIAFNVHEIRSLSIISRDHSVGTFSVLFCQLVGMAEQNWMRKYCVEHTKLKLKSSRSNCACNTLCEHISTVISR